MSSSKLSNTEHNVLRAIITHEGISRSQLASLLHVSMPTVASALKHLHELRYISQTRGAQDSSGGRRPDSYSFAYSRCICIGVLVRSGTAYIIATNLRGDISSRTSVDLGSFNMPDFYDSLALAIESFIDDSHIDTRHLRGIGVTVSSHAALDETREMRLRTTIESRLSYRVRIMREPLALAAAETLYNKDIVDSVCLYLNPMMSSAFIRSGRYVKNSSFVEHSILHPEDSPLTKASRDMNDSSLYRCICGQIGCAQMYCSSQSLLNFPGINASSMQDFINHTRDGEYTYTRAFNTYMDNLALLIHNIRMIVQVPVILGGEVARYLDSSDIADLQTRVRTLTPHMFLPGSGQAGFGQSSFGGRPIVYKSMCSSDQAIIGAAYVLAQDYLDSLLD
ncbi:ROK family transcriptional regulator [Alloscardovia theropitheci]|uniref:ROK family transcriptional regulator n=1 Tax=Alloscardovia theropitheci TaxID=2496842 RepID=A0A4V2MTR9_9BIFI|nr:ROK family transcriptional regulator [Alloscardovia theropitheci]TCD53539.1 ROK family transcriptional regulator [Alloscardovia theropitheci]